jgi:hypothetical protein
LSNHLVNIGRCFFDHHQLVTAARPATRHTLDKFNYCFTPTYSASAFGIHRRISPGKKEPISKRNATLFVPVPY